MRIVRVGLPALVGLLFLLFGIQSVFASEVQVGVLPLAIGIVLLLASVAAARQTRLGYWLGLAVGLLMAVAGLAAIAVEIPFLGQGGLGASIGGGVIMLAVIWTLLWLLYTWGFSKAKAAFATTWTPLDRRLAVIVSVVVAVAAAMFLGIAALQTNAAANAIENDAQARSAVEATTLQVRVLDVGITPASAAGPAVVNQLALELVLRNPQAYTLAASPTLCLTSHAVFNDPGYKQGMLCWGMPGPDDSLRSSYAALTVQQGTTTIKLDLTGAGSPCPMSPGTWNAELTFEPALADGTPAGGLYAIDAPFFTGDDSVPPPPSGAPAASDGCIGVSP
jgi:hypothetical protein